MTSFDSKCQNLQMSPTNFFALALTAFRDIKNIFYLQKVGHGHSLIFAMTPFNGICQNLQMSPHIFMLVQTISVI